jgi:serine/threonine protein kinase
MDASVPDATKGAAPAPDPSCARAAKELGLTVVDLLREGPMTHTWRARTKDGSAVALVVLGIASAEEQERFRRTAEDLKAAGDFRNVLRVHDVSRSGDAMVTDAWTSGTAADLSALRWPVAQRIEFGRRVVEALSALHRAGFVHGALSPESVLLDDSLQPVIGEFGVISHREPFAAPEVCRGEVPTERSDVYSIGRVLLDLLGGEKVPALEEVLNKAFSPLTLVRYANASELGRAMDGALAGVSLPAQPPPAPSPQASARRADLVPRQASQASTAASRQSSFAQPARRLNRTQILAGILGVLLVIAVLVFLFGGPRSDGSESLDLNLPAAH